MRYYCQICHERLDIDSELAIDTVRWTCDRCDRWVATECDAAFGADDDDDDDYDHYAETIPLTFIKRGE